MSPSLLFRLTHDALLLALVLLQVHYGRDSRGLGDGVRMAVVRMVTTLLLLLGLNVAMGLLLVVGVPGAAVAVANFVAAVWVALWARARLITRHHILWSVD